MPIVAESFYQDNGHQINDFKIIDVIHQRKLFSNSRIIGEPKFSVLRCVSGYTGSFVCIFFDDVQIYRACEKPLILFSVGFAKIQTSYFHSKFSREKLRTQNFPTFFLFHK